MVVVVMTDKNRIDSIRQLADMAGRRPIALFPDHLDQSAIFTKNWVNQDICLVASEGDQNC